MQRGQLGVYHIMIVSRWFHTIDDFIHVELATPKARGNMAKWHMNPIPLDSWSRQFFTSLETFHLYSEEDEKFEQEDFFKRVIWPETKCDEEWREQKKENEIYKDLSLDQNALKRIGKIPDGVGKLVVSNIWGFPGTNQPIKELVIPDSVTFIENEFLDDCYELTSLTMPTHWEQIGDRFYNNRSFFYTFKIPKSVKLINGKEVEIKEVEQFDIPSYVTKLADECFKWCNYTKITIPTSIKELPYGCFYICEQLKELEIPDSVTKLGTSCFYNCTSLSSLIIPTNWEQVGNRFYNNIPFFCSFKIPKSVKLINGKEVVIEEVEQFDIPSYVTKLGDDCFSECEQLKEIEIPTSIKEIDSKCFYECHQLKEIEIPSSVTKFGDWLFSGCHSLTSVTLHDNYNEVKQYDFCDCSSLSSIVLPSTLTKIGEKAFYRCDSLTSITIPSSCTEFGKACFLGSGITKENHPDLPDICFRWC